MSVTGEPDGEPVKVGVALLDVITGLQAAIGILAALHERERTGRGRHVSVSLFDASAAAMVNQAANHLIGGIVAGPMGTAHPNICPYQAFHASDRPFILAAGNDRLFRPNVRGRRDTPSGPTIRRFATNEDRVRHREELIPLLGESFATKTAAEWIDALEAAAVPCAPIRAMDEVFASPEGAALVESVDDPGRGTTLRLVRNPIRFDGASPRHAAASSAPRRAHRRGPARDVTAIERWREQLERWAIPAEIIAAAPESPYGFPDGALPDRGAAGDRAQAEPTPTTLRALERLPEGGRVLDVGCGGGATSLPLAGRAGVLVGVDAQEDMLEGFLANARAAGVDAEAVHGRWPEVADTDRPRWTWRSPDTCSTTSPTSSRSSRSIAAVARRRCRLRAHRASPAPTG